ncbi:MAG: hypothetical protein EAZ55_09940 [Cytophagales bacterium]|nr:MAG: hypothetical protein EAZ55_09940 [Cytophagales bacterium]
MEKKVIELAIRMAKDTVNEDAFIKAKNDAVAKLVSIRGIGPEREFAPFNTLPEQPSKVYVGMTQYSSKGKIYAAMLSLGFMMKLMKFMKMMDPLAGIFIKPNDPLFEYEKFADKSNITEIALLKPKAGISEADFINARQIFLENLDKEPEVIKSYTFSVVGGFKNKDSFPHITVYKSKEDFDTLTQRVRQMAYVADFFKYFDATLICFCNTLK